VIITKLQVAPVELVVSSESSCAVRLARHSQNAWARHVERVESCRVETSQVEFGIYWLFYYIYLAIIFESRLTYTLKINRLMHFNSKLVRHPSFECFCKCARSNGIDSDLQEVIDRY